MSQTPKSVALGLAVPLVLAMSGWAGWTALTSNLSPAESTTADRAAIEEVRDRQQPEMTLVEPRVEPSPSADPTGPSPNSGPSPSPTADLPKVSDAAEPVQQPATGAKGSADKGSAEVASPSVAKSALAPVTAAPAQPAVPQKPKIRYVRVPKAAAESVRN
jgi:hypothetical protein